MERVFIIAEAGVNHNGSLDIAIKMVDAAVEAGADAVKFQTFNAENLVTKSSCKAEYQKNTTNSNESQLEMLKKLELDNEAHTILFSYCADRNITFMSTPFDLDSIDLLVELGVEKFKIPSGEITNLPYLRKMASLNKDIILSTGMATLVEVGDALRVLELGGTAIEKITLLHANTMYPTPLEDVNLNAMLSLETEFSCRVGYSDHSLGIEVPIAAAALGAKVIEKHFTLDSTMDGPDHAASLDPRELKAMVQGIRDIEVALGDGIKKPTDSETPNIPIARKSIVAAFPIKKGEVLSEVNLTTKRPGTGISPMRWDEIIGRTADKDYQADDLICDPSITKIERT